VLTRPRSLCLAVLAALAGWLCPAWGQDGIPGPVEPGFRIRPGAGLGADHLGQGRVVVYLIAPGAKVAERSRPADAPFYEDPQPLYGLDVDADTDWSALRLTDANAAGFPGPMGALPPGDYRAQAVLDRTRAFGSWRRETGNLYSDVVPFKIGADGAWPAVELTLDRTVGPQRRPERAGVEFVEVRSELLSAFRGTEVMMRAGVVFPTGYEAGAAYPALYIVPGFGDNHTMAAGIASRRRDMTPGTPEHTLASSVFTVVLDPDGPHGHTLFADSVNNGPVGRALVEELIPALESEFNLTAKPEARLLNGHSSGGWTTLWLATEYPDTFGATWSSAPDPVDFHAFQKINIYEDASMYFQAGASGGREPIPSYTENGQVLMTIAQEIGVENIIGPRNTSGQQWHSWMAVFGPRGADGHPADLYDPATGDLDRAVAGAFRAFDITDRLRRNPGRFGPLFRDRIRLVVGDADSYDLHLAVIRLRDTLGRVWPQVTTEMTPGSIKVVPGADHSDVLQREEILAWPADMLAHLGRSGLTVREAAAP
jgi:hypothetical protein